MGQSLDDVVSLAHRREHPEHSAERGAMAFFGKRRAAIVRNEDIVSAIHAVARGTLDDSISSYSREHQVSNALRRKNRFERTRIEGTNASLGNDNVGGMGCEVLVDFRAPAARGESQ